jgi:Putative Actinobacterial Holin-X, holin superfamily III
MEPRPSDHTAKTSPPQEAAAWQSSLAEFLHTRIELIRLESRDAGTFFAGKACAAIVAVGAAMTAWVCIIVGIIGAVTHFSQMPWWISTLLLGLLHIVIGIVAAKKMHAVSRPLFPVTRGEFEKDKLWMQTLKTPKTK